MTSICNYKQQDTLSNISPRMGSSKENCPKSMVIELSNPFKGKNKKSEIKVGPSRSSQEFSNNYHPKSAEKNSQSMKGHPKNLYSCDKLNKDTSFNDPSQPQIRYSEQKLPLQPTNS